MVRNCDAWVPVAFGFLPDKQLVSYENFLLLVLVACQRHGIRINLKKVYADYEINIHKGFKMVANWIKVRGCYFHFTQKIWREVQSKKFIGHYANDSGFRKFVRCIVGLPFLPIKEIQEAVDKLREVELEDTDQINFQKEMLEYIERFWINGPFPPSVWSCWPRQRFNTNNHHEAYNSRLNKMLNCFHPNPWILLMTIVKELNKAEDDMDSLTRAQRMPRTTRRKYKNLMECRKRLKTNYRQKKISQMKYLAEIGAMSLKSFDTKSKTTVKSVNHSKVQKAKSLSHKNQSINLSINETDTTVDVMDESVCEEVDSSATEDELTDTEDQIHNLPSDVTFTVSVDDIPTNEESIDVNHQEIQSVTCNVTITSDVTLADVDEIMIIETDVPKKPSLSGKKCPRCKTGFKSSPYFDCSKCSSKTHTRCTKKGTLQNKFICKNCEDDSNYEGSDEEAHEVSTSKFNTEKGYKNLDQQLKKLKFRRSPTQIRTIGDGNCGPRSALDQILHNNSKIKFKPDDFHGLRCWVIQMVQCLIISGQMCWQYGDSFTYENWAKKMSQSGQFVDQIWWQGLAKASGSDLIFIPTLPKNAHHKSLFTWVRGGPNINNMDTSGPNEPLFIGYLEDTVYISPHFQSIAPENIHQKNPILDILRLEGGFCFEPLSNVFEVSNFRSEDQRESTRIEDEHENLSNDRLENLSTEPSVLQVTNGNTQEAMNIVNVLSVLKRKRKISGCKKAKKSRINLEQSSPVKTRLRSKINL